jgi:hypothetical protein
MAGWWAGRGWHGKVTLRGGDGGWRTLGLDRGTGTFDRGASWQSGDVRWWTIAIAALAGVVERMPRASPRRTCRYLIATKRQLIGRLPYSNRRSSLIVGES